MATSTEKQIFKRHLLPFKTPCYSKVTKGDTPGDVFITVKLSERVITGKAYFTTGEAVPEGTRVTTLSITGVEAPLSNGDCRGGAGQIDGHMDEAYLKEITLKPGWTMEQVEKLLAVWRDYHLNDMKPGCDHWAEQGFDNREKLVIYKMGHSRHYYDLYSAMKSRVDKAMGTEGQVTLTEEERFLRSLPYDLVLADPNEMAEHLKPFYEVKERETKTAGLVYPKDHERGLLTRECEVCGLKYGSSWYIKQIPQEVIDWLTALPAATKDLPGSMGAWLMNTQKKPQKPTKPYNFERSAKERLRHYRQLEAYYKEHYPAPANDRATWRHYRYVKPQWLKTQYPPTQVTRPDDTDYWCCEEFPFNVLGYADELNRYIRHKGWYTNHDCSEVYRGVVLVARLHGTIGFLPAVTHSDWDGKMLWIGDFEPLEDAKNWGSNWGTDGIADSHACRKVTDLADGYAQSLAEAARDDDAKFQAEAEIERLAEERSELRQEALALIKEIKAAKRQFTPAVCSVLVEKLKAIQRSIQRKRERAATLADDYWRAVYH